MNSRQSNDDDDRFSADTIRRRLCTFKNITLPMCKSIDDDGKLRVVSYSIQRLLSGAIKYSKQYKTSRVLTHPGINCKPVVVFRLMESWKTITLSEKCSQFSNFFYLAKLLVSIVTITNAFVILKAPPGIIHSNQVRPRALSLAAFLMRLSTKRCKESLGVQETHRRSTFRKSHQNTRTTGDDLAFQSAQSW